MSKILKPICIGNLENSHHRMSHELKTVSYHKLYDILKPHQNEVNEIRAKRIAHTANPLALVAQQQPVYHPQNHPTHYTQNSLTRSQQAATRNRGKAIVNSPQPIYDEESSMVAEDDEMSKDKEIDKLMDLISLSFKKIYKPTNNNLRTSLNTSRANQDNSLRINKSNGYENQRISNVAGARETVGSTLVQKYGIQCYNCKEFGHVARECQKPKRVKDELEAHYMYMAKIQEVSPDAADSGPIFDAKRLQKVLNDDHYNVFSIESEHLEQSKSIHDTYPIEQDEHNVIIDSLDMSYDRKQIDQNDVDDDLANERELLASLIEKLKCKIDDSKNRNKFLETSNKKLCAHQETISILSQQKEARIKLYKTREDKEHDKVIALENKVKVLDNIVYKTGQSVQTMNLLNNKCRTSFAKLEFLKKAQRANPRLYDLGCYNDNLALMLAPESDEVICLEKESRSKLCDLIRPFDYDKLNNLYDLLVPQREKSSKQRYFSERSRLSHTPLNNRNSKESFNKQSTLLEKRMDESISWDQKCKSSKELFKIKRSVSTIFDGVERCKETIAKRTYFGHIDPFIQNTIKANFSPKIQKINADLEKFHVCLKEEMVADLRYFNSLELEVDSLKSQLETQKTQFLNEIDQLLREYYYADHMNAILGVYTKLDESKEFRKEREQYFEIQNLKAQLQDKGIVISELKKLIAKLKGKSVDTKFEKSSIIRQPNAFKSQRPSILGKPTIFLDSLERKDFSKSKSVTKNNVLNDFSKPVTAQILPTNKKSILKNTNVLAPEMYKLHTEPTQARTSQLPQDSRKINKRVSFSTRVIPTTSVSRPKLKSNPMEDRVMLNNSKGKKHEVEDQRRNVKLFKNKTSVTASNDSLNAKTLNVNFVCTTYGKCVLNEKHDTYVLKYVNGVISRTKMPIVVPLVLKVVLLFLTKRTMFHGRLVFSGDGERDVNVNETFHEQTDDELSEKELKQIEADDQAIQTILLGLPEDIYAPWSSRLLRPSCSMNGKGLLPMKKNRLSLTTINYLQQPMPNPEDITDPTTAMNMALALMAKAFKLNYSTPTNNNQRISSNPMNRQIAQPGMNMGQDRQIQMVGARAEGNAAGQNGNQIRCYNYRGVEEYDLMAAAADLDEIEEVNANCNLMANLQQASTLGTQTDRDGSAESAAATDLDEIEKVNANCFLMANLQQASTSGTQTDKAPVYDSDGLAEVHNYDNCYDNEIFNMFTQEEQYTELLEPIPEPHQVQQNDSNVISEVFSVEQDGGTIDQHPATVEETRGYFKLLYNNLAIEVESGQPLATSRTAPAAQAPQVLQTPTATTTTTNIAWTPTNSSSQATNFSNTSQDVDKIETQQHDQQQENQASLQPETVVDNVPNAMFDDNTFVNPFVTPSTSVAESSSSQYVNWYLSK
nr:hypothetical protein [Tanacetum cinerariifolium]